MMAVVIVATVKGITEQMDEIGESASSAIETIAEQTEDIEVDEAALEDARAAINEASPTVESGVLANIVEGIDGLIAIAGGLILGALIMYYLLKDGSSLRRSVVGQFDASYRDEVNGFVGDACRILRDYGKGRTIMSAIVATAVGLAALIMGLPLVLSIAVVNFVGRLHPLRRRLPRWRVGRDRGHRRGRARARRDHARRRPGGEPRPRELRRAEGHGPHPRHPSAGGLGGHRARWPPGRDRRASSWPSRPGSSPATPSVDSAPVG